MLFHWVGSNKRLCWLNIYILYFFMCVVLRFQVHINRRFYENPSWIVFRKHSDWIESKKAKRGRCCTISSTTFHNQQIFMNMKCVVNQVRVMASLSEIRMIIKRVIVRLMRNSPLTVSSSHSMLCRSCWINYCYLSMSTLIERN